MLFRFGFSGPRLQAIASLSDSYTLTPKAVNDSLPSQFTEGTKTLPYSATKIGIGVSMVLATVGISSSVSSQDVDPAVTELTPAASAPQEAPDGTPSSVDGESAAEGDLPDPAGPEVERRRSFFGPALALLGLAGAGGTAAALAAGGSDASPQ